MGLHLQFSSLFTDWKRVLHIIFTGAQHYRLVVLTAAWVVQSTYIKAPLIFHCTFNRRAAAAALEQKHTPTFVIETIAL